MKKPNKTTQFDLESFPQWLVSQVPVFDALIIEDIRPTDSWLLDVTTYCGSPYSFTVNQVRRLSEGSAYAGDIVEEPMGTPFELTQDKFPGKLKWKKLK